MRRAHYPFGNERVMALQAAEDEIVRGSKPCIVITAICRVLPAFQGLAPARMLVAAMLSAMSIGWLCARRAGGRARARGQACGQHRKFERDIAIFVHAQCLAPK